IIFVVLIEDPQRAAVDAAAIVEFLYEQVDRVLLQQRIIRGLLCLVQVDANQDRPSRLSKSDSRCEHGGERRKCKCQESTRHCGSSRSHVHPYFASWPCHGDASHSMVLIRFGQTPTRPPGEREPPPTSRRSGRSARAWCRPA